MSLPKRIFLRRRKGPLHHLLSELFCLFSNTFLSFLSFPVACLFRDFRKEFGGDCYIKARCIKIRWGKKKKNIVSYVDLHLIALVKKYYKSTHVTVFSTRKRYARLLIKRPQCIYSCIYTLFYQLFQIGSSLVDYYEHITKYVDYQHLTEC